MPRPATLTLQGAGMYLSDETVRGGELNSVLEQHRV
jgi:hypothetical protein